MNYYPLKLAFKITFGYVKTRIDNKSNINKEEAWILNFQNPVWIFHIGNFILIGEL